MLASTYPAVGVPTNSFENDNYSILRLFDCWWDTNNGADLTSLMQASTLANLALITNIILKILFLNRIPLFIKIIPVAGLLAIFVLAF